MLNNQPQIHLNSLKTASNKAIQKRAEATGSLSGNKIVNKITKP